MKRISTGPTKTKSRLTLLLAAAALVAALALPAGASAGKLIRIDANADPLAPTGKTPAVLFHVTGLTKGRQYRLYADLERGQRDGVCDTSLGNGLVFYRARRSSLDWDTRPGYFVRQPELYEFDYPSFAPCKGTYKGYLKLKGRSGETTLLRFRLSVPKLEMRYIRR
jgi:hypothetical protein